MILDYLEDVDVVLFQCTHRVAYGEMPIRWHRIGSLSVLSELEHQCRQYLHATKAVSILVDPGTAITVHLRLTTPNGLWEYITSASAASDFILRIHTARRFWIRFCLSTFWDDPGLYVADLLLCNQRPPPILPDRWYRVRPQRSIM